MKIKSNNASASCVGSWVKKALYGSAVLGLTMTMGATAYAGNGHGHGKGHGNGHGYGNNGFDTITPYSRVAKLPVVLDENGETDYVATYNKAKAAALALHDIKMLMCLVVMLSKVKTGCWVVHPRTAERR